MNNENQDQTENAFDPCHSDGIPGGCSSCEHRDECIPLPTELDFVRDPAEPHPGDQFLVVGTGEQLTLFDVSDYLDDEEPIWHERFATDTVFTHMEDGSGDDELTLIDFMMGFDCMDNDFRELVINFYSTGYWLPMAHNYGEQDYLLDHINGAWHLATASKLDDLTNIYSHDNCDWVDLSRSYVHLEGEGNVQRFPVQDYFDGFEDFIRIKTIKDVVENVEVLVPTAEPFQLGYIHGKLYVATPDQMSTLIETANIVDQFDSGLEDLGDDW